ncbi:lipase 3-like isoform X2 [Drosophila bipectinata]|uniref:lipase 3-like isoform X2 n=1 Tax=Drosophila bipectinata TaxID=42026 RepID=UPI001C8A0073|nr:lipase 3-like [Drosophila bipectinata]
MVAVLVYLLAIGSLHLATSDTLETITSHNFPGEKHQVVTTDGYILTLFRIPYSPTLHNEKLPKKVVFLQHGILGSSDSWLLTGPRYALPYVLSNSGYEVWLGNSRGNLYGRRHKKLSPEKEQFWQFTFHELGVYDLPAQIDYVLNITQQKELQFVAHSLGGTEFLVMLSENPQYNRFFRSVHLLAPLVFCTHPKSKLWSMVAKAAPLLTDEEYSAGSLTSGVMNMICNIAISSLCQNIMLVLIGGKSSYITDKIKPSIASVESTGVSTRLMKHFAQLYESGHFAKYSYGKAENMKKYGRVTPPDYILKNVMPAGQFYVYQSGTDDLVSNEDLNHLTTAGLNFIERRVSVAKWNHLDYVFAKEAEKLIYRQIVTNMAMSPSKSP